MAGGEVTYQPVYREDELRFGEFNGAFADRPHPIFVTYDSMIDQLLVWLVEPGPTLPTSEYYVAEDTAFLVRDSDLEVVGFLIDQFQEKFLPAAPKLAEVWASRNMADDFKSIKQLHYVPSEKKQHSSSRVDEVRVIKYSAYQTKSARELCLA